ncbi:bet1-like protein At4g14600 isoform X1 [Zingiber officinale]|uniref:bet1-like protein At4g14600 isoform X1 n=1 Tax=Zingiber officinale TaxID=94328 RepID=UPI001C4B25D8|nr:bet1-like protein At4g14600 isoform X1 [Zingiber officinale]
MPLCAFSSNCWYSFVKMQVVCCPVSIITTLLNCFMYNRLIEVLFVEEELCMFRYRGSSKCFYQVAQEIESEAKFQNDFITQLQMTLTKAQAGVKNNMRRMNKSIIQNGSNHVFHVILFALLCFFIVYFWSKISR